MDFAEVEKRASGENVGSEQNTRHFKKTKDPKNYDMLHESQRVILFNLCSPDFPPFSEDVAIRLLGVFGSKEEALEHERDARCTVMLNEIGNWILVPDNTKLIYKPKACEKMIKKILSDNSKKVARNKEIFEDRVKQSKGEKNVAIMGDEYVKDGPKIEEIIHDEDEVEERDILRNLENQKKNRNTSLFKVNRNFECRNQYFAAVSFIVSENSRDFIWRCDGVFNTENEADDFVRNEMSDDVIDSHIYVISLYEWLFYDTIKLYETNSSSIKTMYRNDTLNDIMTFRENSQKQVDQFRAKCEEENIAVPSEKEMSEKINNLRTNISKSKSELN